ncbi:MAG: hypothetical protein WBD78_00940 [Methylocella sp.]
MILTRIGRLHQAIARKSRCFRQTFLKCDSPVAQVQRGALLAKFLEQLRKGGLCVIYRTATQNLTVAAFFGYRNCDFLFMNVETDEAHVGHNNLLLSWDYSVRRRSFPFYTSGAVASVGRP